MADTTTYGDPYVHTNYYFQHQHQQQTFSQIPLTPDYVNGGPSPSGALTSYNSFHAPPSPLHTNQSSSEFWYPSYPSHYGQFPPTPTSPFSSFPPSSHFPSYPPSPQRGSGLPDIPDYLSARNHGSSVPRTQYDSYQHSPSSSRPKLRRATGKAIAELKTMRLSDLPEEDRSCNICMEGYVEHRYSTDQPKREHALCMPCGHVFGSYCIKQWLQTHNTCPACREEVDFEEVVDEEAPTHSRSRGTRRQSLSTHESIVNDLFGEPYRDPMARSRTPHPSTMRSRSYFGTYEAEPRPGTVAPNSRPGMRRSQTAMGSGFGQTPPRYPYAEPPSPGLNRYPSQARMQGIREQPYVRPGSSSSSGATTQSEPTRGSNGYYSQPAQPAARIGSGPSGRSSRRPKCALEGIGLCAHEMEEDRLYTRLLMLDCRHYFHEQCLANTMKARGDSTNLAARLLWCERCRKYLPKGGE